MFPMGVHVLYEKLLLTKNVNIHVTVLSNSYEKHKITKHFCCIKTDAAFQVLWLVIIIVIVIIKQLVTYLSSIRNCIDTGQLPDIGAKCMFDVFHLLLIYLIC